MARSPLIRLTRSVQAGVKPLVESPRTLQPMSAIPYRQSVHHTRREGNATRRFFCFDVDPFDSADAEWE